MSIQMLLQEERSLELTKTNLMKKLHARTLTRSAKNYLYERLTSIQHKLDAINKHRQESLNSNQSSVRP
jgi:hypothetical protein